MAQSKHCPYSFYVPENDAQLMRFVKSQSNLSLSVRLLMKAFLSAYKGEMQDVAAADLSDLIRGVRLENIQGLQLAEQPEVRDGGREVQEYAGEQEPGPAPSADAAPGKDDPGAELSAGPADQGTGTDEDDVPPAQAAEEWTESVTEHEDRQPERQAAKTESEPVPMPEVVEEPEKPVRTVDSQRTAYNESRLPSKKATEDDLMAMMGEGF